MYFSKLVMVLAIFVASVTFAKASDTTSDMVPFLQGSSALSSKCKGQQRRCECPPAKKNGKRRECCRGHRGHHGKGGHRGHRGDPGPAGPQGIQGLPGGLTITPAFASVYLTILITNPTISTLPGDFVPFQNIASAPVGIDTSSLLATGELIIEQAGIYLVTYGLTSGMPTFVGAGPLSYNVAVDIAINGTPVGDGQSGVVLTNPTEALVAPQVAYLGGQRTFTLSAGDRIKLVNSQPVSGNTLFYRTGANASLSMQLATAATLTVQRLQ